jgi:6-phosphofructokinase 1
MSEGIKRIGVFTSGGDCAGLNAVIKAVVYRAVLHYGWEVYGILDGTEGLALRPLRWRKLGIQDFFTPFARLGGTMLGTINKGNPFAWVMPDGKEVDLTDSFKKGVEELGLDALVVIGGDGSMRICGNLCRAAGVKMVGIPKTIDKDTPLTDHSVGFSTALDVCTEALDRLQTTAASHHRVMVMEVMGRDAGHLALQSAIAGGADVCIIPEIPYTMEGILKKLRERKAMGADHTLVVVAEGVKTEDGKAVLVAAAKNGENVRYGGIAHYFSEQLNKYPDDFSSRYTVLGHVQRGGIPSSWDRIAATAFGVHAVDMLAKGETYRMAAWQHGEVTDVSLEDVGKIGTQKVEKDSVMLQTAIGMDMYVGEL